MMALSVGNDDFQPFRLDKAFVLKYKTVKPKFGFDGLGEFVYMRTYSRVKGDGDKERWWETVERVVNGTYTMQKRWIIDSGIEWKPKKAQRSAQEMYDRIFNFKFLPPGRGLWAMGSPLTEERKLFACLNNCAYCTTQDIDKNEGRDVWKPFVFLMDCSMLGIGTGFDTRGAGGIIVKGLDKTAPETSYIIPDSREGWCESVKRLIIACVHGQPGINFDYSKIRPKGARIYGFGGVASGPEPLKILHTNIRNTFEANKNALISETTIVDIMNHIGVCVVAGNVRRTAEISFGAPDSKEYINLKNYELNPHRAAFGWTSNNSVFADIGMDYSDVAKLSAQNGEPGYAWLANMRDYGRMNGVKDGRDHRAMGGNPCLEQTLEPYEMCNLVEVFPTNCDDMTDFLRTLKFTYLYAKTVTLGRTHWQETNRVQLRNRRIGVSMGGIAQFITKNGIEELRVWCERGYDEIQHYDAIYSDWLAIPKSIKTTSIKPSGSISLLAGTTHGIHYPPSRFYKRRVRLSSSSQLIKPLQLAGYHVEPQKLPVMADSREGGVVGYSDDPTTTVIEFVVDVGAGIRNEAELSMWEQLELAALMQSWWADNQISATIKFDPRREGPQIKHALNLYQYRLKGISFLPDSDHGYVQVPQETITEEEYHHIRSGYKPLNFGSVKNESPAPERYCDNDKCEL